VKYAATFDILASLLIDYQRNGKTVKGLIDVARDGYLWFLERTSGPINFVEGKPYVNQTVFKSLDPKTGRRRNLGTFATRAAAEKHERAVQFFKRGGAKRAR
jgi:glucose dehydrogenase